jgi:hypothetical protein
LNDEEYAGPGPVPGVSRLVPRDTGGGAPGPGVTGQRWVANRHVAETAELYNHLFAELEWARRLLWKTLDDRAALEGRNPAVCGTNAGARRHARRMEPPCPACLEGRAWSDKRKGRR